jgi:hypothetical protein
MHELRVSLRNVGNPELAALGLVRQLPALTKLELDGSSLDLYQDPVHWPYFIPSSLKALRIDISAGGPESQSLLGALPGMLEASGARLDRLEVLIPHKFESLGGGLVHVAQALRCCSPTLEGFLLPTGEMCDRLGHDLNPLNEDHASEIERLRVQWADVLAGVSACRELQVLVLPRIQMEPLFPPGTAFDRLTYLGICDHEREHPPDAGVVGLWALMASGGLPALAKLSVRLEGRLWWGAEEMRTRVAPAFEAVAGTLTHLHLESFDEYDRLTSDEVEVGYKLGVAVGKLRRLKDLAIDLFRDGWAYHAVAQGLAASGGDRPLPHLWRLRVFSLVRARACLVASLILPSVRVLCLHCGSDDSRQEESYSEGSEFADYGPHDNEIVDCSSDASRAAFLLACTLRQAGYKHSLMLYWDTEGAEGIVRAIASCTIGDVNYERPLLDLVVCIFAIGAILL